jgi:cysteine synthase A
MSTKTTVWDAVGNTPLIYIRSLSEMTGCHIYGKAEFLNPGGSIKDRAAKGIIAQAEANGQLSPGDTIIEGSAGNTAIGLATLAAERGYKTLFTLPDNQSPEKYQVLRALGAQLHLVPPCPFTNSNHFYHTARRIAETTPNSLWADQFENTANSDFHYQTTGPEIWEQTQGEIDFLTLASGTGGTIGGLSCYLKEKNKNIQVILADPLGSGLAHYIKEGSFASQGTSVTEGIGIMRRTKNFSKATVDQAWTIDDNEMISMCFHLAQRDGLFLGTSSALNCASAYRLARQYQGQGKHIVTILCDSGTRYMSRLLDPQWQKENHLIISPLG